MTDVVSLFERLDIDQDHQLDLLLSEFIAHGSKLMNRHGTNSETAQFRSRFVSKFGFSPLVLARLWQILEEEQSPLPRGLKKVHVLWAMMFAKEYPTHRNFAGNIGGMDEKTATKWAFLMFEEISCLLPSVILWDNRNRGNRQTECRSQIDGIHLAYKQKKIWHPTSRKKIVNRWLYSWKLNGPGLAYQVAIALYSSDIVHVSGPYLPGKLNDLQMFRESGLRNELDEGERIEADQGYAGDDPDVFVTPDGIGVNRSSEKRIKQKKRIDARIETVNANWKYFACMSAKPFRHDVHQHQVFFNTIAVCSQIAIELGELEIYSAYEDIDEKN